MPSNDIYGKISEWLDIYHSSDDERLKVEIKTQIVSYMIPVVKHIARTIARRSYDPIEDMTQAGFIGLLKAIDKYSKEKNDNFRVYAGYFIIGEMKHFLRDKLNMIRVPGHIQELVIRINNFTKDLTQEEIFKLTSEDVASALDVPTKKIDFALQIDRRKSTVSLEEVFDTSDDSLGYEEIIASNDYQKQSEYADIKIIFDEVVNKLPPEERVLLDMYYKQDMTQKEIAEALQISQMGVSRRMKNLFNLISDFVWENPEYRQRMKRNDNGIVTE